MSSRVRFFVILSVAKNLYAHLVKARFFGRWHSLKNDIILLCEIASSLALLAMTPTHPVQLPKVSGRGDLTAEARTPGPSTNGRTPLFHPFVVSLSNHEQPLIIQCFWWISLLLHPPYHYLHVIPHQVRNPHTHFNLDSCFRRNDTIQLYAFSIIPLMKRSTLYIMSGGSTIVVSLASITAGPSIILPGRSRSASKILVSLKSPCCFQ